MSQAAVSSLVSPLKRPDEATEKQARLQEMRKRYAQLDAHSLLDVMLHREFSGKIAVSSSFGAEAAVLLKLIADVDKTTPILFINTGHLFEETLAYKDVVADQLGLSNVSAIGPSEIHLQNVDPDNTLYQRDTDYCCHIRKVLPFEQALAPYEAWISGRKRFQNSERSVLDAIELDHDGRFKINPLYNWDYHKVMGYFSALELPRHSLVDAGYPSIGCAPCTRAVKEGEDMRAGRWAGQNKTECGIHKSPAFEAGLI